MMSEPFADRAELLTPPHNYAVVQLPTRRYPGVVFQGDSLSILCEGATSVAELARDSAAFEEAVLLRDDLNAILRGYIAVLEQRGIELPFAYRPPPAH